MRPQRKSTPFSPGQVYRLALFKYSSSPGQSTAAPSRMVYTSVAVEPYSRNSSGTPSLSMS